MASPTWTWVWVSSRSWWRTGKPGVLQSMQSQRVRHGHARVTKQQHHPGCAIILLLQDDTFGEKGWSTHQISLYDFLTTTCESANISINISIKKTKTTFWDPIPGHPPPCIIPSSWVWGPSDMLLVNATQQKWWWFSHKSCPTLATSWTGNLPGSSVHGIFPGKMTGVGCHFLLQGIFPTQESNPGLLHCRQILYRQS